MPAAVIDSMRAGADEDRLAADRDEQPGEAGRAAREHRHDDVVHAPDALARRVVDRQAAQLRREHPHGRITALSSPSRGARPAPRRKRLDDVGERELVREQARDRRCGALEQAERRAHVARTVVEGAAQRERLVVQAVAVDGHHRLARQAAEQHDGAAGGGQADCVRPGLGRPRGLDHGLVAARRALAAAEQLGDRAAGVAGQREQAAERAAAEDRDALAGTRFGVVGAVHRAGQGLDGGGHLGRDAFGHAMQVHARDAGRHAQHLRVGAVEQRVEIAAELLASGRAGRAVAAGRRIDTADEIALAERRALSAGDDDARVLVAERRRRRAEQHGMPPPVALRVGAAGQGRLDAEHHLARARLRLRHLLHAHVPWRPVARSDHGANTTLSA